MNNHITSHQILSTLSLPRAQTSLHQHLRRCRPHSAIQYQIECIHSMADLVTVATSSRERVELSVRAFLHVNTTRWFTGSLL
jgi:hypothetical protein